jgi:Cu/Ag efflux pump CusA
MATTDRRSHILCADNHIGIHRACDATAFVLVGPDVSDWLLRLNLNQLAAHGVTLKQLEAAREQARADASALRTFKPKHPAPSEDVGNLHG